MGALALVSAAAAMTFRKGSPLDRQAGPVFVASMLLMLTSAMPISIFIAPNMPNVVGGAMAFYLMATGWAAVMRAPGRVGGFENGAALAALGISLIGLSSGLQAATARKA